MDPNSTQLRMNEIRSKWITLNERYAEAISSNELLKAKLAELQDKLQKVEKERDDLIITMEVLYEDFTIRDSPTTEKSNASSPIKKTGNSTDSGPITTDEMKNAAGNAIFVDNRETKKNSPEMAFAGEMSNALNFGDDFKDKTILTDEFADEALRTLVAIDQVNSKNQTNEFRDKMSPSVSNEDRLFLRNETNPSNEKSNIPRLLSIKPELIGKNYNVRVLLPRIIPNENLKEGENVATDSTKQNDFTVKVCLPRIESNGTDDIIEDTINDLEEKKPQMTYREKDKKHPRIHKMGTSGRFVVEEPTHDGSSTTHDVGNSSTENTDLKW